MQRRRVGPMLPTGMPSSALILAYGTGGSWISMAISRWQPGGRRMNASRSAAFRQKQLMVRRPSPFIRDRLGIYREPGTVRSPRGAQHPTALPPGGGGQPARKRGRIADFVKLLQQPQPDALADVVGVGAAQPVPAADGPEQRGVPLDQCVPRLPVAIP